MYATAAPSCSPSGTFLQYSVDSGISVLHKKLFHFSAIIALHKEKPGIFWKERRMLRNSLEKHFEELTESHYKKSKTNCAVTCPLVAGGWRTSISLLLEPQAFFFFQLVANTVSLIITQASGSLGLSHLSDPESRAPQWSGLQEHKAGAVLSEPAQICLPAVPISHIYWRPNVLFSRPRHQGRFIRQVFD